MAVKKTEESLLSMLVSSCALLASWGQREAGSYSRGGMRREERKGRQGRELRRGARDPPDPTPGSSAFISLYLERLSGLPGLTERIHDLVVLIRSNTAHSV